MVVPTVILLLALCLAAVQLAGRQLVLQDAAAMAARTAARGEGAAAASGLLATVAPGARLAVENRGEMLCVRVTAAGTGMFSAVTLAASSCALAGGL